MGNPQPDASQFLSLTAHQEGRSEIAWSLTNCLLGASSSSGSMQSGVSHW